MKPAVILGAGGHSKVIIDLLHARKEPVWGILDENNSLHGKEILGIEVKGGEILLDTLKNSDVELVVGIASPSIRKKIFDLYSQKGFTFKTLIHPSAYVSEFAQVEEGCQILANVTIQANTKMGKNTLVNNQSSVDHDIEIGEHCHIAPGSILCGGCKIGNEVFIGAGSTLHPNLKVGDKSEIGMGSVLLEHVADGQKYLGHPAKLRS